MSLRLYAGRPGTAHDAAWWAAVHALFDEAFPGLPAGIGRAAAVGARWAEHTTPFALFAGARCVAHVGVWEHVMEVDGRRVAFAGIHAVCTAADHRRRGLCRRLLGEALAWAEPRWSVAKLHTDDPPVYAGHGFEVVPTRRFEGSAPAATGVRWRPLRAGSVPADTRLLARLLAERTPPSARLSTADGGSLVLTDAALSRRLDGGFRYLPEHGVAVAYFETEAATLVLDVVGPTLPSAAVVRGAAPDPARPLTWTFCPDRFEPEARPVPAPAAVGHLMVRGDWPGDLADLAISPLWEH